MDNLTNKTKTPAWGHWWEVCSGGNYYKCAERDKSETIHRNFYPQSFSFLYISLQKTKNVLTNMEWGFCSFETIKIKADVAQWLLGPRADHSWKYLFSKCWTQPKLSNLPQIQMLDLIQQRLALLEVSHKEFICCIKCSSISGLHLIGSCARCE